MNMCGVLASDCSLTWREYKYEWSLGIRLFKHLLEVGCPTRHELLTHLLQHKHPDGCNEGSWTQDLDEEKALECCQSLPLEHNHRTRVRLLP